MLYSGTLGHRGQFDNKGMQYARGLMRRGLEAAGAACSKRTGCHICVRGRPCARATLRAQVFKDAARARLCLQPPGDVLGRSHFYAAALAGCVPVLIEGGHRAYDDNGTTWWAWRRPGPGDGPAACAGTAPAREWPGLVDYGAFAVFVRAREMEDPRWALPLVGLAADEARLARMRAALSRVLPRFVYGRGLADGPEQPRDDAFALFEDLLERAARVMRPESRRAVARA